MSAKKTPGKIDAALDAAIAAELTECCRKHEEEVKDEDGTVIAKKGDFIYSLPDRLSVMDRAIKIESIKAKIPDDGWGSKFNGQKGATRDEK